MRVFTKNGLQIAHGYKRIVHGGRGDYLEIGKDDIIDDSIEIPKGTEWRLFYDKAYYIEYRSKDICNVMIYLQKNLVNYADYEIGNYYVSPDEVVLK